jgi:hypothetical protein
MGIGRFIRLAWVVALPALLAGASAAPDASDQEAASSKDHRIERALDILYHVPSGRALLGRAQAFWKLARPQDLQAKFKWGEASKTDAVLTRHFNPRTGAESRERQVTIYLREGQKLDDLVLDIAHELVHATSRPGWDPSDPRLTPGKYIFAAIEGEGGEVQAVAMECRVGFEVHDRFGAAASGAERCDSYVPDSSDTDEPDPELIRRDFYRVGKWSKELSQKLGSELTLFPLLSHEAPKLYSSTGNAPYPVALYREFEEITQIACENSRKRAEADPDRAPAALQKSAAAFVAKRCDKRS